MSRLRLLQVVTARTDKLALTSPLVHGRLAKSLISALLAGRRVSRASWLMRCQKNRSLSAREAQKLRVGELGLREIGHLCDSKRLCEIILPRLSPAPTLPDVGVRWDGATKSCLSAQLHAAIQANSHCLRAAWRCLEKMINRLLLCALFLVISCGHCDCRGSNGTSIQSRCIKQPIACVLAQRTCVASANCFKLPD